MCGLVWRVREWNRGPIYTDWSGLGTGNRTMGWAARVALLYSGIYSEDVLCWLSLVLMLSITQPAARDRRGSEGEGQRERASDQVHA